MDRDTLRRLVKQYVDAYIESEIPDFPAKSARFRYLFSRLRHTALAVIENIAAELSQSDFRPMAFELTFGGRDGTLPGITIREGEGELSLSGAVDRDYCFRRIETAEAAGEEPA